MVLKRCLSKAPSHLLLFPCSRLQAMRPPGIFLPPTSPLPIERPALAILRQVLNRCLSKAPSLSIPCPCSKFQALRPLSFSICQTKIIWPHDVLRGSYTVTISVVEAHLVPANSAPWKLFSLGLVVMAVMMAVMMAGAPLVHPIFWSVSRAALNVNMKGNNIWYTSRAIYYL